MSKINNDFNDEQQKVDLKITYVPHQLILNKLARITSENAIRCQKQIIVIYGEKYKETLQSIKKLSRLFNCFQHLPFNKLNIISNEFFLDHEGPLCLYSHKTDSYILDQVKNHRIVFINKFNHLLLRHCENIDLFIVRGVISGIDILKSNNIFVKSFYHNYTSIEYTNNTNINGGVDNNSCVRVLSSQDVSINEHNLLVNPFTSKVFMFDKKQIAGFNIPNIRNIKINFNIPDIRNIKINLTN